MQPLVPFLLYPWRLSIDGWAYWLSLDLSGICGSCGTIRRRYVQSATVPSAIIDVPREGVAVPKTTMRIAAPRVLFCGTAVLSRRTSLVATSSWFLGTLFFPSPVRGLASSSSCPDSSAPSGMKKTAQELQSQWAGGIDVWRAVPVANDETILICNRVQRPDEPTASSEWPAIVQRSVLFGFGAYNPRGQTLPDDINEQQHASLQADIEEGLKKYATTATFWEAASLWEDGSSEKGFIIAVSSDLSQAQRWVVELATKYNQGAIYKFHYENQQRLVRETVAVLDPGTDATVSVIRDDSIPIPSNLWDRDNN